MSSVSGRRPVASVADIITGTDDNKVITPLGDHDSFSNRLASRLNFSNYFGSGNFALSDGAIINVAHGLASAPSLVTFQLVVTANNAGYVPGDVIQIPPAMDCNVGAYGYTTQVDPTYVTFRLKGLSSLVFLRVVHKTSGGTANLLFSGIQLRIQAWGL